MKPLFVILEIIPKLGYHCNIVRQRLTLSSMQFKLRVHLKQLVNGYVDTWFIDLRSMKINNIVNRILQSFLISFSTLGSINFQFTSFRIINQLFVTTFSITFDYQFCDHPFWSPVTVIFLLIIFSLVIGNFTSSFTSAFLINRNCFRQGLHRFFRQKMVLIYDRCISYINISICCAGILNGATQCFSLLVCLVLSLMEMLLFLFLFQLRNFFLLQMRLSLSVQGILI